MMTYIGHIARVIPQHSITCIRGLAISPTYYYCQHKTLPITLHRFSLKLYIYIYFKQRTSLLAQSISRHTVIRTLLYRFLDERLTHIDTISSGDEHIEKLKMIYNENLHWLLIMTGMYSSCCKLYINIHYNNPMNILYIKNIIIIMYIIIK